jgi:predicted DNA-binding protein with PD1-like motif
VVSSGDCRRERLGAAQITAIGALSGAELAYFDWESKTYQCIPVREPVEVALEPNQKGWGGSK